MSAAVRFVLFTASVIRAGSRRAVIFPAMRRGWGNKECSPREVGKGGVGEKTEDLKG